MLISRDHETIVAQCSPDGIGAVALIRLSGATAFEIADRICLLHDKTLCTVPTHTIHYGAVINQDKAPIDQVLFLAMRAPRTFTGQDTIEITCHNNPFIIAAIIQRAIECGARIAAPGEFTRRAVVNGKIDLLQAEAINDLIHAHSQKALEKSLAQLGGTLSATIHSIEQRLLKAIALCDASFEFLDEEHMGFKAQIGSLLEAIKQEIRTLCSASGHQKYIREGVRIALIGAVNAGKSSLFNMLAGADRAIVTPIAGTTRDTLETGLYRDGMYWTLIDTAGLRTTDDIIEREGINRSYQQAHQADVILLVLDSAALITEQENAVYQDLINRYESKIITVFTKSDLPARLLFNGTVKKTVKSSIKDCASAELIKDAIQEIVDQLSSTWQLPFLINQRHLNFLIALADRLETAQSILEKEPVAYELVSYHLNDLLSSMTDFTGKSISEYAMDEVFRSFCVGK